MSRKALKQKEGFLSLSEIEDMRRNLSSNPRDLLLFDFATQTGLRIKDILELKVGAVNKMLPGDSLQDSGISFDYPFGSKVTETLYKSIQDYIAAEKIDDSKPDEFVFKSRKGKGPLRLSSVSHMIRTWFDREGLNGIQGAATLRKVWENYYSPIFLERPSSVSSGQGAYELKPIETSTLYERVYKELLETIVSGRIRPGEKLVADQIAEQMQVSVMPVREAMHRLEAQGFITSLGRKGSVANRLSKENLEEILQIRLILEPLAAEAATRNINKDVLLRLTALQQECFKSTDADETFRINKEFHHLLYLQSRRPILLEVIESLWNRISPYLHIYARYRDNNALNNSKNYHQKILEGLMEKNTEAVCEWLRKDLSEAAHLIGFNLP